MVLEKEYESVVEFVRQEQPATDSVSICGQFRGRGGDARVVEQQAIDLTEAGYNVTIFALEADMESPEGVDLKVVNPVHGHPLLSKVYWILFPLLPWMVYTVWNLRKFDTIIAHRYPFTIASSVTSTITDASYVYWSHPSANTAEGFSGLAGVWSRFIHRFETGGWAISNADYICAVSEDSKKYLESHIDRSVTVVPNKINERRFTQVAEPDDLREKYSIDDDDYIVLFVGRITERKNIHSLIEVVDSVSEDIDNIKLVIAGSASQPDYAERVKDLSGPNVIFTGYVSDEDLAGLYSISDVFATCSLEEGWGLPITEAQHFDTPAVAFNTHPAAKEVNDKIMVEQGDYTAFECALREYID
ncbi:glycosyltransferase family 4 protein [Halobellus clavatus]|uniref:1,2-diacylglycerol 3-alpha-glucosyltransferase n=1 Tax=Halobellus clavatus TaxID=660517 RepID=A0A1H3JZ68_9EURY|nr:glycosyltransferase family 4 protein [Halobellus clavatus]SDY44628.1 1,2-diacylglycerol 3-alpha-glucosyltransferase [Halobellus clavatus]